MADRRIMVPLSGVVLAQLLAMVDLNLTAAALPAIAADLGGADRFTWVVTAAVLASTVTTPLYGKLSDVYGRRALLVVALAVLTLGSLLCGLAQSMNQLIAARAVQGAGAGGLMISAYAVYAELLDARRLVRYQIVTATLVNIGTAFGPLAGGVLTDSFGWRWAFLATVPPSVLALLLVATLRLPPVATGGRVDYAGILWLGAALTTLVLLAGVAGTRWAWASPGVVVLVVAAAVLPTMWWRSAQRAADPVLPPALLRERVVRSVAIQGWNTGAGMLVVVTFLPVVFVSLGASAADAGMYLLTLTFGTLVVSLAGTPLLARVSGTQWFGVTGTVLLAAGTAWLAFTHPDLGPGGWAGWALATMAIGVGIGLGFQVYTLTLLRHAPRPQLGAALAVQSLSRQVGGSLVLAVLSAVFHSRLAADGNTSTLDAAQTVFGLTALLLVVGVVAAVRLPVPSLAVSERSPVTAGEAG
ncbi:MFS transporter [Salinispora arenicola]|uniref:MFS transporter n=1 Tax=Salinispora arenicola TaxID=168697 RepID=UPI0003A8E358|nr:MFS transporter [Salinispora arenicola]